MEAAGAVLSTVLCIYDIAYLQSMRSCKRKSDGAYTATIHDAEPSLRKVMLVDR
jgi:hypothetical protein